MIDEKYKKEEENFLSAIDFIRDDPKLVEEFIIAAGDSYFPMIPNGEHKLNILRKIYQRELTSDPQRGHHLVQITDKEIEFLQSLPTELIKRLFYSLIIRAKVRPHPSGWFSLDFPRTIFYGLNTIDAKKAKIEILSQLTDFGFETLVIGSTKPVLCFKLPIEDDGSVMMEFEDGEALEHFEEVIGFDTY